MNVYTGFLILIMNYKQCKLTKHVKFFMGKKKTKTNHISPFKEHHSMKMKVLL